MSCCYFSAHPPWRLVLDAVNQLAVAFDAQRRFIEAGVELRSSAFFILKKTPRTANITP
jgi:hypothetical protein